MILTLPVLFTGLAMLPDPVRLPAEASLHVDQLVTEGRVQTLIQSLDSDAGFQLVIGHAGGASGAARAEALRASLVASGLESSKIILLPRLPDGTALELTLEKSFR